MTRIRNAARRRTTIAGTVILVTGLAASGTASAAPTTTTAAPTSAAPTSAALMSAAPTSAALTSAAPTSGSGTPTQVPQGVNPAASPSAQPLGATAAATPLTVSFILKANDLASLEKKVAAGWTGPYLTTAQFAATYGQSPRIISELESYLGSFGITTTSLADDLDVTATGTAAEFNQALSIGLNDYAVPAADGKGTQRVYASRTDPKVPAKVAEAILSILGLSNYAPFVSNAVKTPAATATGASGTIPTGERTPADFASTYHLNTVQDSGAEGQGETIGIVTLATMNPGVPQTFWSSYLHLPTSSNRVETIEVDGGAGAANPTNGSDETDLDVEQSGALADQAEVDVYQAPNTDYGFVDGFLHAAADNVAGSVSASWGESETAIADSVATGTESSTYAETFDEAFLEMGAQGQSGFLAAGDAGAYDATDDTGTTNLAVDNPGDSPYVTSAGATTLPDTITLPVLSSTGAATSATESVTIPSERAWSWNYLWPLFATQPKADNLPFTSRSAAAEGLVVGGGGGYSTTEARPSYQQGVSGVGSFSAYQYLTPTDPSAAEGISEPTKFAFTGSPALSTGTNTTGRAVPDLAYDGDPFTGYALYDPDYTAIYGSPVQEFGGTSFVAPQLNGSTAVIESAVGHRVGFWNPTIYAAAKTSTSPFNPLQSNQVYGPRYFFQTSASGVTSDLAGQFTNDNLYYTGTPGDVFNPTTGLGVGDLSGLDTVFKETDS
jgi:kumamolisin